VSNLPILHAPIRSFCKKIGLGALFSTHNTTNTPYERRTIGGGGGGGGGSYPLRSTNKTANRSNNLTRTATAWDSDEQILCENGAADPSKNITVAREIAIESEAGSLKEPAGWTASVASGGNAQGKSRGG
jgi:hypothetical protein